MIQQTSGRSLISSFYSEQSLLPSQEYQHDLHSFNWIQMKFHELMLVTSLKNVLFYSACPQILIVSLSQLELVTMVKIHKRILMCYSIPLSELSQKLYRYQMLETEKQRQLSSIFFFNPTG